MHTPTHTIVQLCVHFRQRRALSRDPGLSSFLRPAIAFATHVSEIELNCGGKASEMDSTQSRRDVTPCERV